MNYAPRFVSNPRTVHTWNITEDENEQDLTFGFSLPAISDDKEELAEVFISGESLGEAKWINGTGLIPV